MATSVTSFSEALELYNDRYQAALSRNSKRDIDRYQSNINQINAYFDVMTSAIADNNNIRAQEALDAIIAILVAEGIIISDPISLPLSTAVYGSPPIILVPVDNLGTNPVFTNAISEINIYQGGVNVTSSYTISILSQSNVTAIVNSPNIEITAISADSGYVDVLCEKTDFADLNIRIWVYKYYDADKGLTLDAYPTAIFIPTDEFGNNANVTNAISEIIIRQGSVDETANWTITLFSQTDVTAVIQNDNEIKINAIASDEGSAVAQCVRSGYTTLYIGVRVYKYYEAEKGLAIQAYPSSLIIPVDSDGTNPQLTNAISTIILRQGSTDETANWTFAIQTQTNVTAVIQNDNEVKINAITADEGLVSVRASRTGYPDHDIDIPIQKQYKGQAVIDTSSVDQLTIDLNSSDEIILKRDQTGADYIFHSDTPDFTPYHITYGTEDENDYRFRSTTFRRAESQNDNGSYATLNYTYNISQASSILPFESQGNIIIGSKNITEYLSGNSNNAESISGTSGGASFIIVFPSASGDLTSDYVVGDKVICYVEIASGNFDTLGIDYYITGEITSSSYSGATVVQCLSDFTFTNTHQNYFIDQSIAGNNIIAVTYTPFDSGSGAIGSFFNIVFGGYNQISGRDNIVNGSDNVLINGINNLIYGNEFKVNPTNVSYFGISGNILIGKGPSDEIKGNRNIIISGNGNNTISHEDNNANIIIGEYHTIGDASQTTGFVWNTLVGIRHSSEATASHLFGYGGSSITTGEIVLSSSDSPNKQSLFLLEGITTSTSVKTLLTVERAALSAVNGQAQSIRIADSNAFSGILDLTGYQSSGSLYREKIHINFYCDGSSVVSTPITSALYLYNSGGFTATISFGVSTANQLDVNITPSSATSTKWVCKVEGIIMDI